MRREGWWDGGEQGPDRDARQGLLADDVLFDCCRSTGTVVGSGRLFLPGVRTGPEIRRFVSRYSRTRNFLRLDRRGKAREA
ncbi:MAG TPA: hypothetical protein DCE39_12480 [Planctomycetaceae bacterium]|nr:hypothetical protein [Planctomycetaceae bacterium]